MGKVYKARDRKTDEIVAVKVLSDPHGNDAARFTREAEILAKLDHPQIVRYLAHGTLESGEPYIAMEWLDGEDLDARLQRGRLDIAESIALAIRVADALGFAHARGVVHRDLKPSNVFLEGGRVEQVKLLDFGIAQAGLMATRVTRTGALVGTPAYMAPEQARGEGQIDARADVFSLGCVLFECLTGEPAFTGTHAMAILARLVFDEPPRLREKRPEMPERLDALLARMLAKAPEERPRNGHILAEALRALDASPSLSVDALSAPQPPAALTGSEQRAVAVILINAPSLGEIAAEPTGPAEREREALDQLETLDVDDPIEGQARIHGGHLEHLLDGSVAVVLASPRVATDLAAQSARCALSLRARAPGRAIALAIGRGPTMRRLPMGPAIDRAARLVSGASGARIFLDEVTAGLLDARFDVRETQEGFELCGEREFAEGARTLLGKATPCVGRDRELTMLEQLLDECIEESKACALLVTAPAGGGKTRLAHEFLRNVKARRGPTTIWAARGDPLRAGSALSLLGQLLRRACRIQEGKPLAAQRESLTMHVGERVAEPARRRVAEFIGEIIGTPFPSEESMLLRAARRDAQLMNEQMRTAFVELLDAECAAMPVLIVLEDLHSSDRPTAQFLDRALRELRDRKLCVLAMARPEVREIFPNLWEGRCLQEIRLGELNRRAMERLARHVLGESLAKETIDKLARLSEGNAFFLEELIRRAAESRGADLPETVVAMVQSRLGALDEQARRLLRAASAFGEVFWVGGVASMLGGAARAPEVRDRLGALVEREVVVRRAESRFPGEEEYAFRHSLLREGAYAMLTDEDRGLGHRLAGEWLEHAGEPDPLVLAEHLQRGRELERAAGHYLRAGRQSFDRDDLGGALLRAQRGIECGAQGELLGNLQTLRAVAHCWRSELDQGYRASAAALPLVARGSRWECILLFHGTWASLVLGVEDVFAEVADRFARFEPDAEARREYVLWAPLAASLLQTYGRRELSSALLDRAEALASAMPGLDLDLVGTLAVGRSDYVRAFERDLWRQLELTRKAVEAFQAIGDMRNSITAMSRLGQAEAELGARELGEETLRRAVELSERSQIPFARRQSVLHLGALLSHGPDASKWAEAEEIACSVLGGAGVSAGYRGWAHGIRAEVLLWRGAHDESVHAAREADASCAGVPLRRLWIRALLVRGLIGQGQAGAALAAARLIEPDLNRIGGGGYVEIEARLALSEACFADGELEEARATLLETMRRIHARAGAIPDAAWRARYLAHVPEIARARALAGAWGVSCPASAQTQR